MISRRRFVCGLAGVASLLLADQLIDKSPEAAAQVPAPPDPELARRAETLAARLESLAETLEREGANA